MFLPVITPLGISSLQTCWLKMNRHFLSRASAVFPQLALTAPPFRLKVKSKLQGNIKRNVPQLSTLERILGSDLTPLNKSSQHLNNK